MLGTIALYGTAWLALAFWAWSQWLRRPGSARLAWTAGCLANLLHILLAFHQVHHWDHARAYAAVARQTYKETGFDSGVGLYINYAFAALWVMDTMCWWLFPPPPRPLSDVGVSYDRVAGSEVLRRPGSREHMGSREHTHEAATIGPSEYLRPGHDWYGATSSDQRRPRWLDGIIQFIFLFMFFNATVVFGKSPIRLLGVFFCFWGALGWFKASRENAQDKLQHRETA